MLGRPECRNRSWKRSVAHADKTEHHTKIIEIPEAVGVFETVDDLQKAFYDLRMVGFSRSDIRLLARQEVLEEKFGAAYWHASELEDDPEVVRNIINEGCERARDEARDTMEEVRRAMSLEY